MTTTTEIPAPTAKVEVPTRSFLLNPATQEDYRQAIIPKFKRVKGKKVINGTRILHIPSPELLHAQYNILEALAELRLPVSKNAHGYVRSRDILTMAGPHVGHKHLIRIDIKDFFPSILPIKVTTALLAIRKEATELSRLIARTCFLNNGLPQGAPTSPALSNLVMLRVDSRIRAAIKSWKTLRYAINPVDARMVPITYTRYADDLVFSSNYEQLRLLIPTIKRILEQESFVVNKDKIFVLSSPHRLEVCGVVVNEKTSTPRTYRRRLRSTLHRIITQEQSSGKMRNHKGRLIDIPIDSLRSQVAHVSHICPSQGALLQNLLVAAIEVHTQEPTTWSTFTNEYVAQYRTASASAD